MLDESVKVKEEPELASEEGRRQERSSRRDLLDVRSIVRLHSARCSLNMKRLLHMKRCRTVVELAADQQDVEKEDSCRGDVEGLQQEEARWHCLLSLERPARGS